MNRQLSPEAAEENRIVNYVRDNCFVPYKKRSVGWSTSASEYLKNKFKKELGLDFVIEVYYHLDIYFATSQAKIKLGRNHLDFYFSIPNN